MGKGQSKEIRQVVKTSLDGLTPGGGGVVCSLMKICNKCKTSKPRGEFNKSKQREDGRQTMCRCCAKQYREANKDAIAAYHKQHYQTNKEAILERHKQHHQANKDIINERKKQHYQTNKEEILERHKQWNQANKEYRAEKAKQYYQANKEEIDEKRKQRYQANKEAVAEQGKKYREANKEAVKKQNRRYARGRRAKDPLFRLTQNIRSLIRHALSNGGYSKKSRTHEILGCSFEEYQQHIEAQFTDGMSWERMSEIHIDHRLPVSAATTEAEMLVLNHHRNLQPLWKSDNLAKGSSYCPKELEAYLAKYK